MSCKEKLAFAVFCRQCNSGEACRKADALILRRKDELTIRWNTEKEQFL